MAKPVYVIEGRNDRDGSWQEAWRREDKETAEWYLDYVQSRLPHVAYRIRVERKPVAALTEAA